tara:strand:- start:35 stop:355 length:321 start_codon:yes stop_codon:yes gene_type:complete
MSSFITSLLSMPHAMSAARPIGSAPPVPVVVSAGKKSRSKKAKASDVDHSSASAGAGRRNTKEDRMKERREEDRRRVLLFIEDKPTAKDVHEFFVGRVSALLAEHI